MKVLRRKKSLNKKTQIKYFISASFWFIVWRQHKSMRKVNWIKEMNHADTHSKYSSNLLSSSRSRIHVSLLFCGPYIYKNFFYFWRQIKDSKRQSTKRIRRRKFLYCVLLWKFLFHNCPFSLSASFFSCPQTWKYGSENKKVYILMQKF